MPAPDDEMKAAIDLAYEALANPIARGILAHLVAHDSRKEGHRVNEILKATGVSRSAVSKHLGRLEAAGMVTADIPSPRRRGQNTNYFAVPRRINELMKASLDELLGTQQDD